MKILYQERGTGKTSQAIIESHKTGYTIVCNDVIQARFIKEKAYEANLVIPEPISLDKIINTDSIRGRHIEGFIFDDAEFALSYIVNHLTGINVEMITMSIPRKL